VPKTELAGLGDTVRAAVASVDREQIDAAAARITELCAQLQAGVASKADRDALLEWCFETTTVVNSAADFYLGLASFMQVQLYGYGSSRFAPSEPLGASFSTEA
jgi:NAD(P)-dependent dehydrogenase (short-subunit alcohol dehydrogenase family)